MKSLPFNQVHLDFHNGDEIVGIGKDFSEEEFISSLKSSDVESITLFAKCHHGNFYYYTDKFRRHPNLNCNLLQREFDACRKNGIRVSVYISAGIDEYYARRHKDECFVNKKGELSWSPNFQTPGFHILCFNSPYLDLLAAQTEEIVQKFKADEFFLDICSENICYCKNCTGTLLKEGKELTDANYKELAKRVYKKYYERINGIIKKYLPHAEIFHNGGEFIRGRRDLIDANSVIEIEALPTGHWGYDNFPMAVSYIKNLGKDYLGMSGKFHTEWGEFGGYKHPDALLYEAALCIANGARFSVGDQMHPSGKMDKLTYEIIGKSFSYVKERKEYIDDVVSVAQIGVLSCETNVGGFDAFSDVGANRILSEKKYLYHFIDKESDFDKYNVIILPDCIENDAALNDKIVKYVKDGGKLLCSGNSVYEILDRVDLGTRNIKQNFYERNYLVPDIPLKSYKAVGTFIIYTDSFVGECYGQKIATMYNPYFNRTVEHFCSHMHAPVNYDSISSYVTTGKDGCYIPYKVFSDYAQNGELFQKEFVDEILKKLLGDKILAKTDLVSGGVIVLNRQETERRYILHLLYAPTILRGIKTQVIEDLIPIRDISVSLRLPEKILKIEYAPQKKAIDYTVTDGRIDFKTDIFCHAMIAVYY